MRLYCSFFTSVSIQPQIKSRFLAGFLAEATKMWRCCNTDDFNKILTIIREFAPYTNKQNREDAPSIEFKIKILSITYKHIFFKSSLWCKRKTYIFFINCNSYIVIIIIIKKNCTMTLKPSNWNTDDLYNYYTYIKKYYCKNLKGQCKNMKCHSFTCKYIHIVLNKI